MIRNLLAVALTHILRPLCALLDASAPDEPLDDDADAGDGCDPILAAVTFLVAVLLGQAIKEDR